MDDAAVRHGRRRTRKRMRTVGGGGRKRSSKVEYLLDFFGPFGREESSPLYSSLPSWPLIPPPHPHNTVRESMAEETAGKARLVFRISEQQLSTSVMEAGNAPIFRLITLHSVGRKSPLFLVKAPFPLSRPLSCFRTTVVYTIHSLPDRLFAGCTRVNFPPSFPALSNFLPKKVSSRVDERKEWRGRGGCVATSSKTPCSTVAQFSPRVLRRARRGGVSGRSSDGGDFHQLTRLYLEPQKFCGAYRDENF